VYAARELREHADWYYGSASGDAWKELLATGGPALSVPEAVRTADPYLHP
jgi:hypothetical protein